MHQKKAIYCTIHGSLCKCSHESVISARNYVKEAVDEITCTQTCTQWAVLTLNRRIKSATMQRVVEATARQRRILILSIASATFHISLSISNNKEKTARRNKTILTSPNIIAMHRTRTRIWHFNQKKPLVTKNPSRLRWIIKECRIKSQFIIDIEKIRIITEH